MEFDNVENCKKTFNIIFEELKGINCYERKNKKENILKSDKSF